MRKDGKFLIWESHDNMTIPKLTRILKKLFPEISLDKIEISGASPNGEAYAIIPKK